MAHHLISVSEIIKHLSQTKACGLPVPGTTEAFAITAIGLLVGTHSCPVFIAHVGIDHKETKNYKKFYI